jgi:5'-AMP-activated protein kinase regulatory gamma subunit
MLTVLDIIHLIQYYYRTASYDYAAADVETFRLESLRGDFVKQLPHPLLSLSSPISEIENELGVAQPPLLSEHPSSTLYGAATRLIQTHARRLPLLDNDSETGHEVIVSVLTQYRLLKFISINVGSSSLLFILHLFDIHLSVIRRFNVSIYLYENSRSAPMSLLLHIKFLKARILIIQSPLQAPILLYSMLFTCFRNVRSRQSPSSMRKV